MAGFALALLAEALLVLLVLTLGSSLSPRGDKPVAVTEVRFKSAAEEKPAAVADDTEKPEIQPRERAAPRAQTPETATPQTEPRPTAPPPPPLIQLSPKEMAAVDISALPRQPDAPAAPRRSPMGPADTGSAYRDSPRVSGSGPHGETLYAASWYREPSDDELSGYLSTATGPGWALIACRTVADFRVDDCVKVDEYPSGSNMARAVLAAAWQFRVRPPRVGGQSKVGEWVRIRIDYEQRR
jgi:protein TonB